MSWLFIRKLICLHKGKIKFAYKEEQKLVLILIFPIVTGNRKEFLNSPDIIRTGALHREYVSCCRLPECCRQ